MQSCFQKCLKTLSKQFTKILDQNQRTHSQILHTFNIFQGVNRHPTSSQPNSFLQTSAFPQKHTQNSSKLKISTSLYFSSNPHKLMSKLNSNPIHFNVNPFAIHSDSPKNQLFFSDPLSRYQQLITTDGFSVEFPNNDYEWCELDLNDPSQREELNNFLNKNYTHTSSSSKLVNPAEFINDTGEGHCYVIRWKTLIIACKTIELVDLYIGDQCYKAFNGDFLTIHPKFRKTGIVSTITARTFEEALKLGGVIEFMSSHAKLDSIPYLRRGLYNLGLSPMAKMVVQNIYDSNQNVPKFRNESGYKIHELDVEELKGLNERRYKIQIHYSDGRLGAMKKWYICLGDENGNIIVLVPFINVLQKIEIKTLFVTEIVTKNNWKMFINEVLKYCKEKGYDMISMQDNGHEVISCFNFSKNCEMNLYMLNYYPKVKKNEVGAAFR